MGPAKLPLHFSAISEEHRELFSALAPRLDDKPVMSAVVLDFLQAKWLPESPGAHNNLYLLLVAHLNIDISEYENYYSITPEYCDAHYIFIYAYLFAYGDIENIHEDFLKNFQAFVLTAAQKKVNGEETVLALLTRMLIARKPYTPAVQQLFGILRKAACKHDQNELLEKMKAYQEPRDTILLRLELARQQKIVVAAKQAALENVKQAIAKPDMKAFRQGLNQFNFSVDELKAFLVLAKNNKNMLIELFNRLADKADLVTAINILLRLHFELQEDLLLEQDGFLLRNAALNLDDKKIERALAAYVQGFKFHEREGAFYAAFSAREERFNPPKIKKKPKSTEPVFAPAPVLAIKAAEPAPAPAAPAPIEVAPVKKEKREKPEIEKPHFLTGRQKEKLTEIKNEFLRNRQLPECHLKPLIIFDQTNLAALEKQAAELKIKRDEFRELLNRVEKLEQQIRGELKLGADKSLPLEHQPKTWAPDYVAQLERLESLMSAKVAEAEAELQRAKEELKNQQEAIERDKQQEQRRLQEAELEEKQAEMMQLITAYQEVHAEHQREYEKFNNVLTYLQNFSLSFIKPENQDLAAMIAEAQTQMTRLNAQLVELRNIFQISQDRSKLLQNPPSENLRRLEELKIALHLQPGEALPKYLNASVADVICLHQSLMKLSNEKIQTVLKLQARACDCLKTWRSFQNFDGKLGQAEELVKKIENLAGQFGSEAYIERYNDMDDCRQKLVSLSLQLAHLAQSFRLPEDLLARFNALPESGWVGFRLFDKPAVSPEFKRLPFEIHGLGCSILRKP